MSPFVIFNVRADDIPVRIGRMETYYCIFQRCLFFSEIREVQRFQPFNDGGGVSGMEMFQPLFVDAQVVRHLFRIHDGERGNDS